MQALAFWLGYEHERFRRHLLTEGAIVAEFARLLDACGGVRVKLEQPYKELLPGGRAECGLTRADLVLCLTKFDPPQKTNQSHEQRADQFKTPHAVLEIKRANAPITEITDDIGRLARLHDIRPPHTAPSTFLLLAFQGTGNSYAEWTPNKTKKLALFKAIHSGNFSLQANRKRQPVATRFGPAICCVRRVTRASASLNINATSKAHCVVLVQVLPATDT